MGELYVPLCACISMLRGDILLSKEKNKLVNKQTRINYYILKLQTKAPVFIV